MVVLVLCGVLVVFMFRLILWVVVCRLVVLVLFLSVIVSVWLW